MSPLEEPAWVLESIAGATGASLDRIADVARDIRHVIDGLVTDDFTIMAFPFIARRSGNPVYRVLRDRLEDPGWKLPSDLTLLDANDLAAALSLPVDLVERYPVAWEITILAGLGDLRGVDHGPELTALSEILAAWIDTFTPDDHGHLARTYEVSPLKSEKAFEDWLESRLEILDPFGYRARLGSQTERNRGGRQRRFIAKRRPDLVCRVIEDCGNMAVGDWLIIENKKGTADIQALEQVRRYIDLGRLELAEGDEKVFGLLLADGATVELQEALHGANVGYISLSALGYRDFLREGSAHDIRREIAT